MTAQEIAELEDALRYVDADARETWVTIAMGLHADLPDATGRRLFDDYARRSKKFDPATQATTWRNLRRDAGGITIKTIFKLARDAGWRGNGGDAKQAAATVHRTEMAERRAVVAKSNDAPPLTLAALAAAKKIPLQFLLEQCCADVPADSPSPKGVAIGYYRKDKTDARYRVRKTLHLHEDPHSMLWANPGFMGGKDIVVYGTWRPRKNPTLFIVEGESDCWSLWVSGYDALGIPGASMIGKLTLANVEGWERAIVVQEPDETGASFAAKAPEHLNAIGFRGEILLLRMGDSPWKDPSDCYVSDPATFRERFDELLKTALPAAAPEASGRIRVLAKAPFDLAEVFVAKKYSYDDGEPTLVLRSWQNQFWRFDGTCWIAISDSELSAQITQFVLNDIHLFGYNSSGKEVLIPPTPRLVNDVLASLHGLFHLSEKTAPPTWIGAIPTELSSSGNLLAFQNGLLDLGADKFYPPNPNLFALGALRTSYEPASKCPEWEAFLKTIWPDDPESIDVLQEAFGYLLTADRSLQKGFMLVGPPRSGKGVIVRTLRRLWDGVDFTAGRATCVLSFTDVLSSFGLETIIGRSVAVVSDARLGRAVDKAAALERLLSIIGNDDPGIPRKFKPSYQGPVGARVVVATNELPAFEDPSGALATRFIMFWLKISFEGREDAELESRIAAELPGIANWAIAGWFRLQERGRLVMSSSGRELREDFLDLTNPLSDAMAALFERDDKDDEAVLEKHVAHGVYRLWCEQNKRHALNLVHFCRGLATLGIDTSYRRDEKTGTFRTEDGKPAPRRIRGLRLTALGIRKRVWYDAATT